MAGFRRALANGSVVISDTVYSELASYFTNKSDLDAFLSETSVRMTAGSPESLFLAGRAWRSYTRRRPAGLVCPSCSRETVVQCSACGAMLRTRQHVVADFLIA